MWTIEKAGGRRAGSGRERGDDGRACKHCFKVAQNSFLFFRDFKS